MQLPIEKTAQPPKQFKELVGQTEYAKFYLSETPVDEPAIYVKLNVYGKWKWIGYLPTDLDEVNQNTQALERYYFKD